MMDFGVLCVLWGRASHQTLCPLVALNTYNPTDPYNPPSTPTACKLPSEQNEHVGYAFFYIKRYK